MIINQISWRFWGVLTKYKTHFLSASLTILAICIGWAYQPSNKFALLSDPVSSSKAKIPEEAALNAYKGKKQMGAFFIENQGQTDESVRFYIQEKSHTVFFTDSGIVLNLIKRHTDEANGKTDPKVTTVSYGEDSRIEGVALKLSFIGVNTKPVGTKEEALKVNYFIGNDPERWKEGVATYSEIAYKNLCGGIDIIYKVEQGNLKYDLVVNPGADVSQIRFACEGAEGLSLADTGDLIIKTAIGDIMDTKPHCYQEIDGREVEVGCNFVILNVERHKTMSNEQRATHCSALIAHCFVYGFEVAYYNKDYPLVVDPSLVTTFLGGSSDDSGNGVAVDDDGNVYVTGSTSSIDFPTTSGVFQMVKSGNRDAFIAKLGKSVEDIVYSTFLGGSGDDRSSDIAVDESKSVYVIGTTNSSNFPTTMGAYDESYNGLQDAFVAKLDSLGGLLLYSTFLGGTDNDDANGIAVDASGRVHVAGGTRSTDFPTTLNTFDDTHGGGGLWDAFAAKLNPAGTGDADLEYSTYLGGDKDDYGTAVALGGDGDIYVTGWTDSTSFPVTSGAFQEAKSGLKDTFITKLRPEGAGASDLIYSTYLGGTDNDNGNSIKVDTSGHVYTTGTTASLFFPTTPNAYQILNNGNGDAFVTKLNPVGGGIRDLKYSTYLGGGNADTGTAIINVGTSNYVYVTGYTNSDDFPLTIHATQGWYSQGNDAFVTMLQLLGLTAEDLIFSTFLGMSLEDKAWDITFLGESTEDKVYVTGHTTSPNFPTSSGAFNPTYNGGGDSFVGVFNFTPLTMNIVGGDCVPTKLGSYDTPGTAHGIFVSGSTAYVADYDRGLQIIDVSDPTDPTLLGSYDTPGEARDVQVLGNVAYVADGDRVLIIDVSNPGVPVLLGNFGTEKYSESISVSGGIAYVTDVRDGLQIVDVFDPGDPRELVVFETPAFTVPPRSFRAFGIHVSNNIAYVANGGTGLEIVDVSVPTNPTLLGSLDTPIWARNVHVSGNIAYVTDGIGGLQIINVSVPTNPTLLGSFDTPGRAWNVYVSDKTAYVADWFSLQIINIFDPTVPMLLSSYDTPGYARDVYVSGPTGTAYVADGESGLQIIDVSGCGTTTTTTSTTTSTTTTTTTITTTTTVATTTTTTTTESAATTTKTKTTSTTTTTTVVCQCSVDSPKGCISGRVTDLEDLPLVEKTIKLKKKFPKRPRVKMKTRTDSDGCYQFADLEDGEYKIKIKRCKGKGGRRKIVVISDGVNVNDMDFECKKKRLRR